MNGVLLFLSRVGIDKAIIYVMLGRGWGVISGIITIALISKFLTAEHQGYYYTFSSVVALQVFFELGFGGILAQFASHEMGKLSLKNGVLKGDPISRDRLLSLVRLTLKWYSIVVLFVLITLSIVGFIFFNGNFSTQHHSAAVHWVNPWFILVILTSLSMYLTPIISLAEGCGLVVSVNKMRVRQAFVSSIAAWLCLVTGNGLYATSAIAFSILVVGGRWIYKNFMELIRDSFYLKSKANRISWLKEIFPMQWRVGLSWISGYFILQFLTPLAFKRYGPVFAGQLGLSLSLCTLMLSLSMAWINTKIPFWGKLISQRKNNELNASYENSFKYSCLFFILMILVANVSLLVFDFFDVDIVKRVLPFSSFIFLCLCLFGHHVVSCQATYVRAHKVELYTRLSVTTALVIFFTVYSFSCFFSYEFMMPIYFIVTWILFVPWSTFIFINFKNSKYVSLG